MVIEDLEHVLAPLKRLGSDALKIWILPDPVRFLNFEEGYVGIAEI